jgi:XTP/dITP diphosphohydrolase
MPGLDPCQTLRQLLATMHTLRGPDGCPWDAEQTPQSLAPYLLEEACESVEAIERGDAATIIDELGDLLLQIVFQAEIFSESNSFDFADVAAAINTKLMRRHPHVFGAPAQRPATNDLAQQWEAIKSDELSVNGGAPHLAARPLPDRLPALQLAQKLVRRLRSGPSDQTADLPAAVPAAISERDLGQALLALVRRAEASALDAEQVLRRAVRELQDEAARTL